MLKKMLLISSLMLTSSTWSSQFFDEQMNIHDRSGQTIASIESQGDQMDFVVVPNDDKSVSKDLPFMIGRTELQNMDAEHLAILYQNAMNIEKPEDILHRSVSDSEHHVNLNKDLDQHVSDMENQEEISESQGILSRLCNGVQQRWDYIWQDEKSDMSASDDEECEQHTQSLQIPMDASVDDIVEQFFPFLQKMTMTLEQEQTPEDQQRLQAFQGQLKQRGVFNEVLNAFDAKIEQLQQSTISNFLEDIKASYCPDAAPEA